MYNPFLFPLFIPFLPNDCDKPPTLYSIMNSIVNYNNEEPVKIKNLALNSREKIFDFDYPLSSKVNKKDFEVLILNHFLMRRIGFDTFTSFKIQLYVKLNEIMPLYNKMFDVLDLEIGDITKKNSVDDRTSNNKTNTSNTSENTSENNTQNTSDRRYSNTPQNDLENVRDGKYVTEYNYDTNNATSNDRSNLKANTESNSDTKDKNIYDETTTRINMIEIYKELNEELKNIYSLIFKDLDCLFYQLI